MKTKLRSIFSLALIIVCILTIAMLFTACDKATETSSTTKNGRTPIYQGMTISGVASASSDDDKWDNGKFDIDNPEDGYKGGHWEQDNGENVWVDKHGNKYWRKDDGKLHHKHHAGCQHGNYSGCEDETDISGELEETTEIIEESIESTLNVIGAGQEIYYATINQDIYITIKLSNPDSYEILSFVLNGKKYSSYMFEVGLTLKILY